MSRLPSDEGLIVNRRKRKDDSALFPGIKLQEYVKGVKAGATMVGSAFECATEKMLGTERRTTDGTMNVCPDGIDERRKLWVESKSTQRQHAFKVPVDQLEMYDQAQYEAAMWEKHYQVLYCLWTYNEKRVTKPRDWSVNGKPDVRIPTREELTRLVLGAATHVDVIDISVLRRMREGCEGLVGSTPDTCSIKDYASWAGYDDGQPYCSMNIGHRFLARLRVETEDVLKELELNPNEYRWKKHRANVPRVVINSVRFPIPVLDVFELLRPEGWTQYGEAVKDAPF